MRKPLRMILLLACLTGAAMSGCSRHPTDAVVLIVVDTLRPDRLSCYDKATYSTPHIDSLAAAGVRFTRANSASSWALPSMGSMMTSRYPSQLGLVERAARPGEQFGRNQLREQMSGTLSLNETTLAEIMQAAGYKTAAFVNQPVLNAADGFVQGFDDYHYATGDETVELYDPARPLAGRKWPASTGANSRDAHIIESLYGWLRRNDSSKVFAWVHLLTPHKPYTPPPWTEPRTSSYKQRLDTTGITRIYAGEVIATDEIVGQVVNAFDRHFGADRTVIILVSSNGEAFGEHGTREHGRTLHNEVTLVPLIVRAPSTPPGRNVKTIVSTLDIFPTVLELGGVTSQATDGVNGESLVPLFGRDGHHHIAYAEGILFGETERALTVDGKRLLLNAPRNTCGLFDIFFDPEETVNLTGSRPAVADSLRQQLDTMHRRITRDGVPEDAESAARVLEALRTLGHTD